MNRPILKGGRGKAAPVFLVLDETSVMHGPTNNSAGLLALVFEATYM
jgi:hypothetical protein